MLDDYEFYEQVAAMLDPSVDKSMSAGDVAGGEPESAVSTLLDEAYCEGKLTPEIVSLVERRYTSGPVAEMLVALRMADESKND